ncbi:MAG: flagellar biosynthetic protein FliP, partial [Ponticaulis sp.]|nr:flagellar biosynthetic protein FliP [Ponticaulis sp.]
MKPDMKRLLALFGLLALAGMGLPALAQEVSVDLGTGAGLNRNIIQLIAIITV